MLKIENLTFSYTEGEPIIKNLSLEVKKDELLMIVGNNASGKSTLAKLMMGLLTTSRCQSRLEILTSIGCQNKTKILTSSRCQNEFETTTHSGCHIELKVSTKRYIGFIGSNPELQLIANTVAEDIAFGMENQNLPPEIIRKRVKQWLSELQMENLAEKSPHELTQLQQQQVVLAGILATEPEIIILDEPTLGLDPEGRDKIFKIIKNIKDKTIIYVTSSYQSALAPDRILYLFRGCLYNTPVQNPSENPSGKLPNNPPSTPPHPVVIDFRRVSYNDGDYNVLRDIHFQVLKASTTLIHGTHKSGKTALLQLINGLLLPTAGSVSANNYLINPNTQSKQLIPLRKKIGYSFQYPEQQLFANTVLEDVMFAPLNFGKNSDEALKICKEILSAIGIGADLYNRHPATLSFSQKKLVTIAASFVSNPDIVVLDEPLLGLDVDNATKVMDFIRKWQIDNNTTIVIATNNTALLMDYADEIFEISDKTLKFMHKKT